MDREMDFSKFHGSNNVEGELFPAEFLIDLLINNPLFLDGKTTHEKSLIEMEKSEEKETDDLSIPSSDDNNHVTEVAKEETRHYDRDILLKIRQYPASLAKFGLHDYLLTQEDYPFTCLRAIPNTKRPEKVTKPSQRNKRKKDTFVLPPLPPKPFAIYNRELVELHTSENPWIPVIIMHMKNVGFKGLSNVLCSNRNDQIKQISLWKKKKALGILNKITFETLEKFCTQFLKLEPDFNKSIDDEIVNIIVKKAISEEKYCGLYVTLLNKMIKQQKSFQKKVLDQFQLEFNQIIEEILKLQKMEKEISIVGGSSILEYREQFKLTTEKKMALKSNCSALMKAIGELYKSNLIAHQTIVNCFWTLMETMHDLGYQSVCLLLTQVGQKLEGVSKEKLPFKYFQPEFLNTIFSKLEQVANEDIEISWSTLCAILNVIDFRKIGWKKTIIPETPIKPTPLQESNDIDGNWRSGNKPVQSQREKKNKNRKCDIYSEPKAINDIQGEIVYRRFRPNTNEMLNFERM